ncbi:MAG: hypothetical protein DIZ78_00225 [endosymbiont of Escarpia spicata]|uniref:Na/Pi cotransporter family protein n=1 Tax=endosymbiont of Escarpia spicata TaxID=2200908 RepID=A0A370DT77_9GAMM|nr:MAG: hypothetical protein DIZ78_00225 [endosymbiont of Escarpia spicata]
MMRSSRPEHQSSPNILNHLLRTTLAVVLLAIAFFAFAAEAGGAIESPDWLQLFLGLFGGLALFLGGLQLLSDGMTKSAGQTLKTVLAKLTTNRLKGALTGAFITGVLNSSTVTTLLVVGFISGGMMTLTQSVGVIMGANIGSTVTAQLLAFDLAAYSLGPVAIGFFMLFTAKREKVKYYGMMIMDIGLVFYGMGLMSEAMTPLRSYEPFLEILKALENPMAGILAGAAFTAIVQSSAATVGIAIAMASEGLLALPAGIGSACNIQHSGHPDMASLHLAAGGYGGLDFPIQPGVRGHGSGSSGSAAPDRQRQYTVQRHQHAAFYRFYRLVREAGRAHRTGAQACGRHYHRAQISG